MPVYTAVYIFLLTSRRPPRIGKDGPPGLEQADKSTTANESIPAEAALPVRLPLSLVREEGPRRSERHQKDTHTYLKAKYPDSQL